MGKYLSIIVPTYNMEKYLDRCLSSLVVSPELMDRVEVFVVNDGSKDRSSEIAHEYEHNYPQTFRVVDKENGNYGSCINAVLPVVSGKYVKVLDADDFFDTEVLAEYVRMLSETDADLIFNGMAMVDESGGEVARYCFERIFPEKVSLSMQNYSTKMNGAGVYMQNVAYRTSLFSSLDYRQTEGISYTDQEWLFTPLFSVQTVTASPMCLYKYCVGRDGQTISPDVHMKNMWMELSVTKKMISDYVRLKDRIEDVQILSYIQGRLLSRIRFLYVSYLLSDSRALDINQLIGFDKSLASSATDLYAMSDAIAGKYGIKYVRQWRRHYSLNSPLFLLIRIKNMFRKNKEAD